MTKQRNACALLVFVLFLSFQYAHAATDEERVLSTEETNASNSTSETELVEPYIAVLFPWFIEMIGILAFFFITRYFSYFPYTAIMFIIGTFMGIAVNRVDRQDQISESTRMWENINSEVLLLVFLPGLIFHDAYSLNVHLFQVSFWQCFLLAFPMVLAGTVLTACVAFYIFPYGWSFNLAMTFGSILSATDPVAVSALLGEVGAPPRLKMHISGESLLNDGSAIVFYNIFSGLFLTQLGVEGVGEYVNVAQGFALFFRMALGGALIGIAFGIGLVSLLFFFNRRLSQEENVMQVASTITVAYVCYYVADIVAGTSGVIAVVFCGVVTKAFGASLINDLELMENFWVLVEHLLNTLLFALGGAVWGSIIANVDPREFSATDWGYLILLYVLLMVIRFALVGVCYPIISRIGLKTNWRESVFLSYAGLRGAVGISLAIALDDEVIRYSTNAEFLGYSTKLFGMVGGIAFLTLFINGSTAGFMLQKLGLSRTSEVREKLLQEYDRTLRDWILDYFVGLLRDPIFTGCDFSLVRHHLPSLDSLSPDELKEAVLKNKESIPVEQYQKPNLDDILPYLICRAVPEDAPDTEKFDMTWVNDLGQYEKERCKPHRLSQKVLSSVAESDLIALQTEHGRKTETRERRLIFLELLKAAYSEQIEKGYIDVRTGSPGLVAFNLEQGIEFAIDAARSGQPMNDWDASFLVKCPLENTVVGEVIKRPFRYTPLPRLLGMSVLPRPNMSQQQLRLEVTIAVSFLEAHKSARKRFEEEFCTDKLSDFEKIVEGESLAQSREAEAFLQQLDQDDVKRVLSHVLCLFLLNKASCFVTVFAKRGLLTQQEANERIHQIEMDIEHLRSVARTDYPGALSKEEKEAIMEKRTLNYIRAEN